MNDTPTPMSWDERKRDLARALRTCAEGDTSPVWAVVEEMQSDIDTLTRRADAAEKAMTVACRMLDSETKTGA